MDNKLNHETKSENLELSNEDKYNLLNRLRRISGQVKGLQKMIENNRDLEEVARQISSARQALNQVLSVLVTFLVHRKVQNNLSKAMPDPLENQIRDLLQIIEKYG